MFTGVLPTTEILKKNISWESHLIGAIMGVFVAYFFKEELEEGEHDTYDVANEEKGFYFERTIFDKTKAQRQFEEEERNRIEQELSRQQFPPFGEWFSNNTF
jgi:hypothetical protein